MMLGPGPCSRCVQSVSGMVHASLFVVVMDGLALSMYIVVHIPYACTTAYALASWWTYYPDLTAAASSLLPFPFMFFGCNVICIVLCRLAALPLMHEP